MAFTKSDTKRLVLGDGVGVQDKDPKIAPSVRIGVGAIKPPELRVFLCTTQPLRNRTIPAPPQAVSPHLSSSLLPIPPCGEPLVAYRTPANPDGAEAPTSAQGHTLLSAAVEGR